MNLIWLMIVVDLSGNRAISKVILRNKFEQQRPNCVQICWI